MIYFILRRIILAISILFLGQSPYIQISINSVSSFSILIFYISYKPYKESKERFLAIFNEGCFFIVTTSIYILLKEDLSDIALHSIDWSISGVLYVSVFIPFLVDLFDLLKALYRVLIRRSVKPRSVTHAVDPQNHI
jgi:hypothetical protein